MTVSELIEALSKYPGDNIVVLASDSEGNSYSPVYATDDTHYLADTSYSGDIVFTELTREMQEEGYDEDDVYEGDDVVPAVVIWPTN